MALHTVQVERSLSSAVRSNDSAVLIGVPIYLMVDQNQSASRHHVKMSATVIEFPGARGSGISQRIEITAPTRCQPLMCYRKTQAAVGAVVTVGDGRGFVVRGREKRYVITAGHCLPWLPPCHTDSRIQKRTYGKLLARMGAKPSVCCECLFVDLLADLAILGPPDNQQLAEEAAAYERLVAAAETLTVAEPPGKPSACELARARG